MHHHVALRQGFDARSRKRLECLLDTVGFLRALQPNCKRLFDLVQTKDLPNPVI